MTYRSDNQNFRALLGVKQKLDFCNIHPETVVHYCEKLDKNKNELIHEDDFEEILKGLIGPTSISQREIKFITDLLSLPSRSKRHLIEYKKFPQLFEVKSSNLEEFEHWNDDYLLDTNEFASLNATFKSSFKKIEPEPGTIGEFLSKAACVSEKRNYALLMSLLETYEKQTGFSISIDKDSFRIPLGPDLEAKLNVGLRK